MIKGSPEDDAVLCTSEKTYNIRSVTLSNAVLVVSPCPDADGSENRAIIQDSLNELLELVPAVPKLHRMNALLKEHEWEEGHEEDETFGTMVGTLQGLMSQMVGLREEFSRRSGNDLPSTRFGKNSKPASKSSRKHSRRSMFLS